MNSKIPETDLIVLAERDVIGQAKLWAEAQANPHATANLVRLRGEYLLAAVTLLEAREAMKATEHLDSPQRDPDHLSPVGGN